MEQSGWLGSFKVSSDESRIKLRVILKKMYQSIKLLISQVFVVYMSGVVAGSLGTSLSDSSTYLAGASGGVSR